MEAIKLEFLCFPTIKFTNLVGLEPIISPSSTTFKGLFLSFLKKTPPSILGFQVCSVYVSMCLSVYLCIYVSKCLSTCLSVYLCIYALFIYLYIYHVSITIIIIYHLFKYLFLRKTVPFIVKLFISISLCT